MRNGVIRREKENTEKEREGKDVKKETRTFWTHRQRRARKLKLAKVKFSRIPKFKQVSAREKKFLQ